MTIDVLDQMHNTQPIGTSAAWPSPFAPPPRPLPPEPRPAPAPFLSCGLTEDELLRRAVANARAMYVVRCERWAAVGVVFELGRKAAIELCQRVGLDPFEMVPR